MKKRQKVRPLSPPINKRRVARAFGIVSTLSAAGLLGYRLFVSTPQYVGPESDMRGKTVLVTESTARMSRDILQGLARRGAHLILASASLDACSTARDKLLRATGVSASRVDCRRLELDSTNSVRRFAAGLLSDYPKLDRAIIQSPSVVTGVVAGNRRPTHDGFEHQLGTNYFSSYLLSRLIWDRLSETGGWLVLVVDTEASSKAAESAAHLPDSTQLALPIDDLNFDHVDKYEPKKAYQRSQWFLTLFADELARRSATTNGASILLADPLVSRGTAPISPQLDISQAGLAGLYYRLTDFGARIIRRRAATTTLFCAVADPNVLELTGLRKTAEKDSSTQRVTNGAVVRAPVYRDLRLLASATDASGSSCMEYSAGQLLWAVSEKWTRLDTHPEALPLPKRP
ncbi:Short chain dehydrogenase [Paragonimus kellicotti]|nr:Short chain dehydrogenase [Paragonimus kellicotti]